MLPRRLAHPFIVSSLAFATPTFSAELDYGADIQPLLAEHCYACHGPDSQTREAGLRFDDRGVATAELESGRFAIVPGEPEQSELVRRIFSKDPDELMPPPDFRKRPSEESKARLKRWIAEGAAYSAHWAFEPAAKPTLPKPRGANWSKNPIDRFVLHRLEQGGMRPSPRADQLTLIRRLSLDFRGLPPSPEELDRLADADFPTVVATMLDSPHYGERMAQDWLDLARYGDTNGYHNDSDRSMWLYRDYVIAAFNNNKPYDRFIIENMAGDLLPAPTQESKIASGFNRCVTFNEEGGADPDEFFVTYAVDRTNTMGQVFLGLTIGCAQCHDHKYDPISQKDYYQLFAFCNSVEGEIGAGGKSGYHNKPLPPLLKVEKPERKAQIAELGRELSDLNRALEQAKAGPATPAGRAAVEQAAISWAEALGGAAPTDLRAKDGLRLHLDAGAIGLADGQAAVAEWPDLSGNGHHAKASGAPQLIRESIGGKPAVRLDGAADYLRTAGGAEGLGGDFTMIAVLKFYDMRQHQMAVMWGDEDHGKRRALWKTDTNKLSFNGYHADVVGEAEFKVNEAAIAIVGQSGEHNLTRFSLNGHAGGEGTAKLSPFASTAITIGANNAGAEKCFAEFAEVLLYDRSLSPDEQASIGRYLGSKYSIQTAHEAAPAAVLAIAAKPAEGRSEKEREALLRHFVHHVHAESRERISALESGIAVLQKQRAELANNLPTTMVMVEMKQRKPAFVLNRGDFQQAGEQVQPEVPSIFPPLPNGQPRNRLALAHWLTDPEHPLVARVTVNRIWKQLFGTGLVKTMGDFGTQGERPSHPELLDWLAAEFVESGWDVKRLQRLIANSATYQQSSHDRGEFRHIDPANRLLSRAPRFRLSAEEVRDAALAASGLLNRDIGGPSVMPYQPPHYLKSIGKDWKQSPGAANYRRGLYTFWRRTMLYPAFQIFDAPSREFCSVNRPRTNTPLQALVTLNDPAYIEAAKAFAGRIHAHSDTDRERLRFGFRVATSRPPKDRELAVLESALGEQRTTYRSDRAAAEELAGDGEAAAWTAIANVLLNLDETISRE